MGIDLGKIMVTPRGDYQDYVEYDWLDLVAYQGSSYIALKPVEGITPSEDGEYWQLHGSGAYQCAKEAGYEGTEEEFRAAQAGMAGHMKEKNPHGTTASDVGAFPIIDARSADYDMDAILKRGRHFALYETGASTLGTPFNKGVTASAAALILSYNNSLDYGIQFAFMSGGLVYTRAMVRGTISEWTTGFLPLTGGTLNGQLLFKSGGAVYHIVPQSDGNFIIRSTTMGLCLNHANNLSNFLYLTDFNTGVGYKLFGEHNKPTGTYTGNGSSTKRTISVGGTGKVLFMMVDGKSSFVTYDGAITFAKDIADVKYTNSDAINFRDGILTIATSSNYFNPNGIACGWYLM